MILPYTANALYFLIPGNQCNTSGIVAAIFQSTQAVDQYWQQIIIGYSANYSAHINEVQIIVFWAVSSQQ